MNGAKVVLVVSAALAGCAVGPDFQLPAAPAVTRYTEQRMPARSASAPDRAGAAQRLVDGAPVSERWWTVFGSRPLDELVEAALRASPDLQAAQAALRAARENVLAQQGAGWPGVDGQASSTRQSIAQALASPLASNAQIYDLHTAQLDISFAPDVFGANRRLVESLEAQADVQRFQREAATLSLASNVVVAAIQEASLRAQIAATRDIADTAGQLLAMARRQQALGQIGAGDVAAQETVAAQARAALPPLEKQLAQQRDLLAVLAGRFPGEELAQRFELASLTLPGDLPLSLPSQLVEQRPDIRAASAQLHAACAQVGVAEAARLPSLTLTANAGRSALTPAQLLKAGGGFWSLGAGFAQPIFEGGSLKHRQRAAEAAFDQAAAQYRSSVLTAFQNVADTLHAIDSDAQALAAASQAERAANRSLEIARKERELGAVGTPALLAAQQAHAQTAIALVQAEAARFADTTALFQALGGGWWNRPVASD